MGGVMVSKFDARYAIPKLRHWRAEEIPQSWFIMVTLHAAPEYYWKRGSMLKRNADQRRLSSPTAEAGDLKSLK